GAGCTVACVEVPIEQASDFGIMAVDNSMAITDFLEKPKNPPAMAGKPDRALASMGVYVFSADFLYAELERDHRHAGSSHDFGKDVIPHLVSRGLAVAHSFEESCVKTTPEAEAYWRHVSPVTAVFELPRQLIRPDLRGGAAAGRPRRAPRAAEQGGRRPRLPHKGGTGDRRRSGPGRETVLLQRRGCDLGQRRYARRPRLTLLGIEPDEAA